MGRLKLAFFMGLVAALAGCLTASDKDQQETDDTQDSAGLLVDEDQDGYPVGQDCDDTNPGAYPGAVEICNGIDDNCNDILDEGFDDVDQDGVADCVDTEDCDGLDNDGDGETDEAFGDADGDGVADCVDGEDCDGIDNNGDGQVDEGYDADGDGFTQCGAAMWETSRVSN